MANHLIDRRLRQVPITFKFRPEISFSISVPKKYAEKIDSNSFLVHYAKNANTDLSKIILDIIFKELKIKNYQEYNKLNEVPEAHDLERKILYKLLNKGRREFSDWILEEVLKEIEKLKKEQEK